MKKMLIAGSTLLLASITYAQQKEGRVVYERTMQIQMRFDAMGGDAPQMLPRLKTDKFEVMFANNQSLRRMIPDEAPEDEAPTGGVQVRVVSAGADDIIFSNLASGLVTDQREFAGKKFIVADSVRKLNWKITGESKTILNYPCQKAVAQRIGQRTTMGMENGLVKSKTVIDTSNITAWFTGAIPVSAGPDYQGQLPGLILEINVNNGSTIYKTLEVSAKVDLSLIKEPKNGKKVTLDEFIKERDKVMEEMRKNMGGRARTISAGNQ